MKIDDLNGHFPVLRRKTHERFSLCGCHFGADDDLVSVLENILERKIQSGLPALGTALRGLREIAYAVYYVSFLSVFAEASGDAGLVAQGLVAIDEALARSERSDERWCLAEVLRVKGEFVLLEGAPRAATEAEEHFSRALQSARDRGALSWELRCSLSLARLRHQQGEPDSARELLSSVYGRFTEGFDTADLKAAKALLGQFG